MSHDSHSLSPRGMSSWIIKDRGKEFVELPSQGLFDDSIHNARSPLLDKHDSSPMMVKKRTTHRKIDGIASTILAMASWRSNDRNLLITGNVDNTLNVWDLDNSTLVHVLIGHTDCIRCVAVSKDGEDSPIAVSGSADRTLVIWSITRGELIHRLYGHNNFISAVAISKDPAYPVIVSGSWDKTIKTWDVKTGDLLRSIEAHSAPISCIAVSGGILPVIISGSEDDVMKVWDMASGALLHTLSGHHQQSKISSIAVSCSDVNTTNPILVSGSSNGCILLWDLLSLTVVLTLLEPDSANDNNNELAIDQSNDEISALVISNATSTAPILISGSWDKTIKIWDTKTGVLLRLIEGHSENIYSVILGFDKDEMVLISAGADRAVSIWTIESDLIMSLEDIRDTDTLTMLESIQLVGKFIIYWKVILNCDVNIKPFVLSPEKATIIFHCLLRSLKYSSSLLRTNVAALSYIFEQCMTKVDLLKFDFYINSNAIQFMLENRLCIGLVQRWIRIGVNMKRVVHILSDSFQSTETLDSILSAVIGQDGTSEGWEVLESSTEFREIFRNLLLNSIRSHDKIITYLRTKGLRVEKEPYPSPLHLPPYATHFVTRWKSSTHGHIGSSRGELLSDAKKGGVFCYRVRVNPRLPIDFLLSQEFTSVVASSPSVVKFVSVKLVEYIIQYKWESWGWWATLLNGLAFFVYLITTTSSMLWICSEANIATLEHNIFFVIATIGSLVCNSIYMVMSLYQMSVISKIEYFSNLWNMGEVLMIILCHLSIILGVGFGPTEVIRSLCTGLTLLLWSRTLYFGRGSFPLAYLIDALKHIIFDMRYFILILTMFLVTFAIAFRVLGVFDSLFLSFMLCFNMMLGDISLYYVQGHYIAQILYVTFLVSVAIVLLNSLIAFMEHSLQAARQRSHTAALVSRIKLIRELEFKMKPLGNIFTSVKRSFRNIDEHEELIILFPENEGKPDFELQTHEDENVVSRMNELFRDVHTELSNVKNRAGEYQDGLNERITVLEDKVSSIDDKLDRLLQLMMASKTSQSTFEMPTDNGSMSFVSFGVS